MRQGLIQPSARRRRAADHRRFERRRPLELWQMDILGAVRLSEGAQASIVSGLDDHSRFVISARVVARATAGPVCEALGATLARYGAPREILTDNGRVFTGRFGPARGEVMFDRICREQGIRHILTAPRAPTTIGKLERWHKTLRTEFLTGRVFASIADAQAQLEAWVHHYNHRRRHQGIGDQVPAGRFALGQILAADPFDAPTAHTEATTTRRSPGTARSASPASPTGWAAPSAGTRSRSRSPTGWCRCTTTAC